MKQLITILMLLCSVVACESDTMIKKAQAGNAKAQSLVADGYFYGRNGFLKNCIEAVKWYKLSAEQGQAEGIYGLGRCYMYGDGVVQNEEEAVRLYLEAAAQGHGPAMHGLGLYYKRHGNNDEAIHWFKKFMDTWYAHHGKEHKFAAEELRDLGVEYHPGSN